MVVLENTGSIMNSNSSQYLQPDYLSPLPTTLDSKKSPLALLAQTCSQIGADSSSSKPLLPALDKPPKKCSATPPATAKHNNNLAFKPYEANVLTRKGDTPRPSSRDKEAEERRRSTPAGRKTASPGQEAKTSPAPSPKSASPPSASPIIRSGLEILQGHPKDMPLGTFKLGLPPGCCPPGLEPSNPAFRPPFAGAFPHMLGYPSPGPYVSYARVKTAGGGEALVPVCKDPYCGGCQLSMHNALMGSCPSGCTQCDHQKYNLAAALSLVAPPPHHLAYPQLGRPYVCNWIAADSYCGKRFATSDELLSHLRTHTTPPTTPESAAASLLRYPAPSLSPRYHPYSKPGLPTASALAASPFSAFNPTLNPYYSPYALYGQRIGAAVHP